MKPIEKLLKYTTSEIKNIAEFLDEEKLKQIANDVIKGYHVDDDSRANWLSLNKKALEMINQNEFLNQQQKDFPLPESAKVIYPLIINAVIQLASRMIMHLVRNGKVCEVVVLGKDEQQLIPNPNFNPQSSQTLNTGNNQQQPVSPQLAAQPSQSPYIFQWKKASKAKRVEDYFNYELLIEDNDWLEDEHRLCHIVAAWGVGFKKIYYDSATKSNCSELLDPEDVIINNNLYGGLEKAPRITLRCYLTKNDIIEKIRSGYFLNIEEEELQGLFINLMDNKNKENDSQETMPKTECLEQYCYIDLDDDGYAEPYCVYVAKEKRKVLGIYPAFKFKDINVNPETGEIICIKPSFNIVDRHLISSPEGKYYSLGLNHLLLHQNKSITTILRQLIDAGTYRNAASCTGFMSKSLKTRERTLRVSMGQFVPVDVPQGMDINKMIANLPAQEPSQVLLQLLQLLIESAKESGFITELLTGQTEMQNVPATTMLATIEQGTRSFKPVVQKLFRSIKQELKLRFNNYKEFLQETDEYGQEKFLTKYAKFQGQDLAITSLDFDDSLDISPVADPTTASDAHKFAKDQALVQMLQTVPGMLNPQSSGLQILTDLEFNNPESLIAPPQQPQPDPKVLELQYKMQMIPLNQENLKLKHENDLLKMELEHRKLDIKHENDMLKMEAEHRKIDVKNNDTQIKSRKTKAEILKSSVDAHKEAIDALNEQQLTKIEAFNADTERQRINILAEQSRRSPNKEGTSE